MKSWLRSEPPKAQVMTCLTSEGSERGSKGAAARKEGRAMTLEEAISYALEED